MKTQAVKVDGTFWITVRVPKIGSICDQYDRAMKIANRRLKTAISGIKVAVEGAEMADPPWKKIQNGACKRCQNRR